MIDAEYFLTRIRDFLQTNLNNFITALNTEKNDSIVLSSVANEAYFLQSLNNQVANFDPHVFIFLSDNKAESQPGGTVKGMVFEVILIMADDGNLEIGIKALRYGRILEDIFNKGFDKIEPSAKFIVNSLVPIPITSIDSNDPFRAVGVELIVYLG